MKQDEILARLYESFRRFPLEYGLDSFTAKIDAIMHVNRHLVDLQELLERQWQHAHPHVPNWRSAGSQPVKQVPIRPEDMPKIGIP